MAQDKDVQESLKNSGNIPVHIAIIMDGNGRWAKKKGLPRIAGHRTGVESVRDIVRACAEIGVKYLTLYTFSTENWKRPQEEVSTLMKLLLRTLKKEIKELNENDVRLTMIGDLKTLPVEIQDQLQEAADKTKENKRLVLNLALSYSGRWEITDAVRKIASDARSGTIDPDEIDQEMFSKYLQAPDYPDPDLLIRTSGELRISNFLLWQIAYSEIVITDVFWPDFRRNNLYEAIKQYQNRERRFGKVSEQINRTVKA